MCSIRYLTSLSDCTLFPLGDSRNPFLMVRLHLFLVPTAFHIPSDPCCVCSHLLISRPIYKGPVGPTHSIGLFRCSINLNRWPTTTVCAWSFMTSQRTHESLLNEGRDDLDISPPSFSTINSRTMYHLVHTVYSFSFILWPSCFCIHLLRIVIIWLFVRWFLRKEEPLTHPPFLSSWAIIGEKWAHCTKCIVSRGAQTTTSPATYVHFGQFVPLKCCFPLVGFIFHFFPYFRQSWPCDLCWEIAGCC